MKGPPEGERTKTSSKRRRILGSTNSRKKKETQRNFQNDYKVREPEQCTARKFKSTRKDSTDGTSSIKRGQVTAAGPPSSPGEGSPCSRLIRSAVNNEKVLPPFKNLPLTGWREKFTQRKPAPMEGREEKQEGSQRKLPENGGETKSWALGAKDEGRFVTNSEPRPVRQGKVAPPTQARTVGSPERIAHTLAARGRERKGGVTLAYLSDRAAEWSAKKLGR